MKRFEITHFVETLYQNQAYPEYSAQDHARGLAKNVCLTYGEILTPSLCQVLSQFPFHAQDVWLDLGSGMGKTLLTTMLATPIQTLIGYEANDALTQIAQTVFSNLPQDLTQNRQIILKTANFLEENLNVATLAYICATCFTEDLLDAIAEKLNQSTNLRMVISLKPIDRLQLPFQRTYSVECSWDSSLVYIYQR